MQMECRPPTLYRLGLRHSSCGRYTEIKGRAWSRECADIACLLSYVKFYDFGHVGRRPQSS